MTEARPSTWKKTAGNSLFLFFAVFIPGLAWAIEALTGVCGDLILDPMPNLLHLALIALVPITNFLAYQRVKQVPFEAGNLPLLTGAAAGVATVYTGLFLPTFPIGVMAAIVGIGLLLLAPLFGLLGALKSAVDLKKQGASLTAFWPGFFIAVALIFAADIPVTVTQYAMARNDLPMLRAVGNREVVLRACYMDWRSASDLPGLILNRGRSIDAHTAREQFYRMTGQPFNVFPRPPRTWRPGNDRQFDAELAGEEVGGRVRGLSLKSSQLRSKTDPKAGIAYTEWTMEFYNTGAQAEARAQVALPPGGVVSRVTLWVKGEEREAAFAAVEHARQAYEDVVNTRRDPLLVTTSGPDRIMFQCFPVPSKGTMKIRLGITAPAGRLPRFIERNFAIDTAHDVDGKTVSDLDLATLSQPLEEPAETVWCPHPDRGFVVATTPDQGPAPKKVTLVVDGSASMVKVLPEVAAAAGAHRIIFAGDEPQELTADQLKSADCVGGQDAFPALLKADEGKPDLILWVHAQQPVELQIVRDLNCPVFSLQVGEGPNRVLEKLENATTLPRTASLREDIEAFLKSGPPQPRNYRLTNRQPEGHQADDHLVRLWAAAESQRLRKEGKTEEARALALRHQLVTPLTGAVVLENKEQYEEAGLEPVDAGSVPTIPEPGIVLLLTALAALALRKSSRR